jgi:hypothetical protein
VPSASSLRLLRRIGKRNERRNYIRREETQTMRDVYLALLLSLTAAPPRSRPFAADGAAGL